MRLVLIAVLINFLTAQICFADNKVFFVAPHDGAEVTSPVKVQFGLKGMQIGPLGDLTPGKGHHHLIIDGKPIVKGEVVPADAKHIHFGKGQTETEVKLEPGEHTLTMQFADGAHRSYGPQMATTIRVIVKKGSLTSKSSDPIKG